MDRQSLSGKSKSKKLIFLADTIAKNPDELMADFQQFYGLNAEQIGGKISYLRAAALVTQLPLSSRVLREKDSTAGWTNAEYLLSKIDHDVRVLAWSMSDKHKRGEMPEMITPQKNKVEKQRERAKGLDLGDGNVIKLSTDEELKKAFGH